MTPLSIAYVAVAAVCFMVALQHLLVALRVRNERFHLLFAAAAMGVAGSAYFERQLYWASTAQDYRAILPWTALCIVLTIVALVWFIDLRTGAVRRWLAVGETILASFAVLLDFTVGVGFSEIKGLSEVHLPWGETIHIGFGPQSPWLLVGHFTLLGPAIIFLDATIQLLRRGERRTAWVIGGSLAIYCAGLLTIPASDWAWINLPPVHTFSFLLIVAVMNWHLSDDVVRAAYLSDESRINERRWRQLIEDVQLLVARINPDGQVVAINPHFEKVLGYKSGDVIGRLYWNFLAPEYRESRKAAFLRAMEGEPTPEVEVTAMTAAGDKRRIVWRNVVLSDAEGNFEGMLSLGTDLTERLEAETARNCAVKELEVLKDRLEEENVYLREEIRTVHGFENIIGNSDALLYVLHKVRQVAPSVTSVLILGETGVGKELIARTIHSESSRSDGPFVVVNCAALPPNLIESELFGHERGAFTGAERLRRGRFELADGGTLFLDEVGELPLELQPKLLRVLQEGQIERLGGSEVIDIDVRVIAATNRDLAADIVSGGFREDLFYRVAVYPITVPPLRDRREDIPVLVEHFSRGFAQRRGVRMNEVPAEVMRRLQAYDWPGNVREVQNVIERMVLTSADGVLRLTEPLKNHPIEKVESGAGGFDIPGLTLDEVERRYIVQVLEATGGQVSGGGGAAEILGLHANTLRYRMKKLGISVARGKGTVTVNS